MTQNQVGRRISDHVASHADEMIAFLQKVVQARSVWGDVRELGKLAKLLGTTMEKAGVIVDYPDSGTPGAPNVMGRVGELSHRRNLLFNGHFDVYPPSDSWSFPPFTAPVRDGRVYGPGSADMKGGTTAMVMAATVLAALDLPKGGQVTVLGVPNHFEGGEGTRRALDAGLKAEAAIVCEPTDLDICAAQRGILYLTVRIKGIAAHSTAQHIGVNAIEYAIPIIQAVKSPSFTRPALDAFGPEKIVNVSMIEGGLRRCLIPEKCTVTIDIRFSPSTTAQRVLEEVKGILAQLHSEDARFVATVEPEETCVRNPRSPMDWVRHPIRDAVALAHEMFGNRPATLACHPAWPDTPVFGERGIPAVTYGPGSKYCYWDEEYVSIEEYLKAIRVYAAVAANWFAKPA